jgi:hypothetical protein
VPHPTLRVTASLSQARSSCGLRQLRQRGREQAFRTH